MNIDATFRPIHRWPQAETRNRRRSRFQSSWGSTLSLLKDELRHLRAKAGTVVIQLDLQEREIRLDGYPRANARPATPRVILSFETPDGAYSYPCDTWNDWQDNIRAIALSLQALRAIDRYGVTRQREQYSGWRALPAGGDSSTTMTTWTAAQLLARLSGYGEHFILDSAEGTATAYRRAAKESHPDAGGSVEDFQRLQVARLVLDQHHGDSTRNTQGAR